MRTTTLMTSARFGKSGEPLMRVNLPHTWNHLDGQDGGNDYWRGIGIYEIDLPDPTPGDCQYIELQGANHVATVYCNGRELGTHKGGFSTFRYELTPAMRTTRNVLQVVVSNAESDIYPQTADFTFYGGLYRDVNYIEVSDAHFDLLKDGSQGVFVTPHCSGKTRLDLFPVNAKNATITVELKNDEGEIVGSGWAEAKEHTMILIDVKKPHLWQGIEDPYCYTAKASIIKNNKATDSVEVVYGYRSFSINPDTGFHLNGKQFPLHGVSRHQDRLDKGWAISKADNREDVQLIKEIGANTIRLAHYQHDQYFYDLCDKEGFVLWAEIPFITKFIPTKEAYENTMCQMKELIAQNYNHPSIFFWGIANEILIGEDNEPLRKNLRDLNQLAKSMDPGRKTTIAQVTMTPMDSEHNYITDIVSYNHYFGWYVGDVSQNGPWLDAFHTMNPDIPLGVSEYGVENILKWHSADPVNHDYTEEYASYYHHEMLKTFVSRPYLWSTYVWNMFDFAADARDEGGIKGRNNKGLVSYDRKIKKDAFYIYKAYWNPEPFVYVAGRRFVDRAPEERNITVYTNLKKITLMVNDSEVETRSVVDHMAVFEDVPLNKGKNTITVKSGEYEDAIILNGVEKHNDDYTLPDLAEARAVGNWFEEIADFDDSEEIEVIEGYYSVEDTNAVLLANKECEKIVKGWLMANGNLTMTSMLSTVRDMMGSGKLVDAMSMTGEVKPKELAKLNRMLNRIKK
ncbi:MAG: glycoside hydrolase family 2 TIM barrel-domain containing protein [Schaedlerella sp.]|nr:glycoside hydrolase family 2 TIM barrel-domain containing protein [Schaedlerella sp.]